PGLLPEALRVRAELSPLRAARPRAAAHEPRAPTGLAQDDRIATARGCRRSPGGARARRPLLVGRQPERPRPGGDVSARPDVSIVGGTVHVEPAGIWGKASALTWSFPLRAEKPALEPHAIFFASNVAFRRDVFEGFPFPDAPGTARRACVLLARRLREHG